MSNEKKNPLIGAFLGRLLPERRPLPHRLFLPKKPNRPFYRPPLSSR